MRDKEKQLLQQRLWYWRDVERNRRVAREYMKKYCAANPLYRKKGLDRSINRYHVLKDDPTFYAKCMLKRARDRARWNNIEFNLTIEDIVIPEKCPVLGLQLRRGVGGSSDNSPSLDRINHKLGYVKGNIIVVSQKVNAMKNNATPDEILAVGYFYKNLETK